MNTLNAAEVAWVAGLLERNGSILSHPIHGEWTRKSDGVHMQRRYPAARFQISMADREPLDRFVAVAGIGRVRDDLPHDVGRRSTFRIDVSNRKHIRSLLRQVGPHLTSKRRDYLNARLETALS